jgi:hypothetical protein
MKRNGGDKAEFEGRLQKEGKMEVEVESKSNVANAAE